MGVGTNQALGGGGFHHIAMRVKDFERSYRFYTETLGFREVHSWERGNIKAAMLDAGDGSFLEVFSGGEQIDQPASPLLHFALRCKDCDAVVKRVRAAGCTITVEPKDVDIPTQPDLYRVRIAFCQGPDCELIEFFQER